MYKDEGNKNEGRKKRNSVMRVVVVDNFHCFPPFLLLRRWRMMSRCIAIRSKIDIRL
jgi:hypothetical protein